MLSLASRHGLRGAFVALLLIASLPALADAFDDEVARLGQARASFGHDIDAEGKVADFVKAGLGAFEIPNAGAERLKKIMVNGFFCRLCSREDFSRRRRIDAASRLICINTRGRHS